MATQIEKILIANRGEIGVRLIRTVHALGLRSVAVYTDADATAAHVKAASESYSLGPDNSGYNQYEKLVAAAVECGAHAVLPGYGFVSENHDAARAFERSGVKWIGPTPEQIKLFGSKTEARRIADEVGVPTVPGSGVVSGEDEAVEFAEKIGYPVLLKAVAGGGGMGQAVARTGQEVKDAFRRVSVQAASLFGDGGLFVEKYVRHARHIEVQVFGGGEGDIAVLGLRDCSVQRRRQKVVEEGPPSNLDASIAKRMRQSAAALCGSQNYRSAGTVEFVVDTDDSEYYFLEVNTRLQVEHGVTELTTGIDIVQCMIEQAMGKEIAVMNPSERGFCIQARVYAENPTRDFLPSSGILSAMQWPDESAQDGVKVRVDSWTVPGTEVTTNFDPLLGKVLVHAPTRAEAISALKQALAKTRVRGVCTNISAVRQVLDNKCFASGKYDTKIMDQVEFHSNVVQVVCAGLQSSLQDYPGRVGFWSIGVSPSGPMDAYAMNAANALVGNDIDASALEMTVKGCTLQFHTDALIALAGARFEGEYNDGYPVPWWTPFRVRAGTRLELGTVMKRNEEAGDEHDDDDDLEDARFRQRPGGKIAYLAVRGGFDAPKYLGSSATFPVAKFGGEHGRFLQPGDFLSLGEDTNEKANIGWHVDQTLPENLIPSYFHSEFTVGALNGPHGSDDFFHHSSLREMWTEPYKVHHAANRLGVRLHGPTPKWTRSDGGSAGLHPSNLHDYTYAPGAVNYSGNTPIVLMLDGPSLGGFLCPITVASAEMWKISQATAGTSVRFRQVGYDDARRAIKSMRAVWDLIRAGKTEEIRNLGNEWTPAWVARSETVNNDAIVKTLEPARENNIEMKVAYRMSGDEHILVEYGDIELDLSYRLRVHTLMETVKGEAWVKELCPGVRSLLIKYDAFQIHVNQLVSELSEIEQHSLESIQSLEVPSRVVKMPLAFDCKWTKDALQRYQTSVRPDAPYLPSNTEFARRVNGLATTNEVRDIMLSAEYCVMGLGDVYLGAPCAVPLDPRHRLVTTKMAPARLFTHEGTVGIGGSYLCIYGMDSPGGYQLMGRTIPIWDTYGTVPETHRGAPAHKPWLLEFFDRIKFYLVTDDELEELRSKYKRGELVLEIEDGTFSYADHRKFLVQNKHSIEEFRRTQTTAFAEERARWEVEGEAAEDASAKHAAAQASSMKSKHEAEPPLYATRVRSGVAATVFEILADKGGFVNAGECVAVMESMKVELRVEAPVSGTVLSIEVGKGDLTDPDTTLCVIQSTKELAFGDMTVSHLRFMYKVGVLEMETAMEEIFGVCKCSPNLQIVEERETERNMKKLKKLVGRKYLPLYGIPFVSAVGEEGAPRQTVDTFTSVGAIHIGNAPNLQVAADVVLNKKVCFAVVSLADEHAPDGVLQTRLREHFFVLTRADSDASTVRGAFEEASRI